MKLEIVTVEDFLLFMQMAPMLPNPTGSVSVSQGVFSGPLTVQEDSVEITFTPAAFMGYQEEPKVLQIRLIEGARIAMMVKGQVLWVKSLEVTTGPMTGGKTRKKKSIAPKPAAKKQIKK